MALSTVTNVCPWGFSSACAIFERFSTALHYIASRVLGIKHMVHVLDDFLGLGPPSSPSCQDHLNCFLRLCRQLGVPIKTEKTEAATTTIIFLGLELDSFTMEARLPADKLIKLRDLLHSASQSRKIKLRNLQSLLSLLIFSCLVATQCRPFSAASSNSM